MGQKTGSSERVKVIHTLVMGRVGMCRPARGSVEGSTPAQLRRLTGERSHGKNSHAALSIAEKEPAGGRRG